MAKQDDFVRITLRMPAGIHAWLTEAAGAGSMNAEIIRRLDESLLTERAQNYTYPKHGRIVLDAEGRALTRAEIQQHLAEVMAASEEPIRTFHIEVLTPEVIESNGRASRMFVESMMEGLRERRGDDVD